MRDIDAGAIEETVARLCVEANIRLNTDIKEALSAARLTETSENGRTVLGMLLENASIAVNEHMPICQDTGMAVVFLEIGQDVRITGGFIGEAIYAGVRDGYKNGYLRNSVVSDPINRVNTNDNTPAIIHYEIVRGDRLKIIVAPKGFGSENMSAVKMLKPSDGIEGVKRFIAETVKLAGANPCPPVIIGAGIGGTMDKAAYLSKKALLRPIGSHHKDAFWAGVEDELLASVNDLGIGPAGLKGNTTALGVMIETFPTHIAGLPAAVNIGCHVTRRAEAVL
ncbi:MAG: fumarate hydratase [Clostridiales bacterium]|nr:fumarate hydratase [Clostridiales bacterium]